MRERGMPYEGFSQETRVLFEAADRAMETARRLVADRRQMGFDAVRVDELDRYARRALFFRSLQPKE
jgi:hypothetical protein